MTEPARDDVRVAVSGRTKADGDSLLAALDAADLRTETPDDLRSWAAGSGTRAVIVDVDDAAALDTVVDLRGDSFDLVLVTLLADTSPESVRRALTAGASATAPADAPVEEVVEVVRMAVEGNAILPTDVARRLAVDALERPTDYAPSLDEIGWIQSLASGTTVAALAAEVGCSKSEMSRRLHDLYERVGVDNRVEAFIRFARWGLLG